MSEPCKGLEFQERVLRERIGRNLDRLSLSPERKAAILKLEVARLMLATEEPESASVMICAHFLAGASVEARNRDALSPHR